ncbi:neuropeptide F receptor-like isoform X2 [Varroa jacobsoni]|uniref:G-protein coupled receptors family 1 profile domain-containing protein n=1 Tax=Varroa destructor TaxID=109461 RepID=A0A7M7KZ53_VARDE|nr:neuropeptide F receptor-like [Varroa destructor]XP_022671228.1 neuropeptide F receptor-like [Varroa destructor]XP_022702942.1 neuropeptide F receptor-like isoform X2 [Varroa jacobsoni]
MQPPYTTVGVLLQEDDVDDGVNDVGGLVAEQQHVALLPTLTTLHVNDTVPGIVSGNGSLSDDPTEHRIKAMLENMMDKTKIMAIEEIPLIILLTFYSVLIMTGAIGNGLVCVAVARKPAMRTARNVYIINLAISDLILCLFTMPFTLVELILRYWPLGTITCKLVGGLEATSIFVSTISITAIAIDRYMVIIYPSRETFQPRTAFFGIWCFALLLAAPLFASRIVEYPEMPPETRQILRDRGFEFNDDVTYCIENWPHERGRFYYSIFTLVFQYMLPIIIVSLAYASICRKLQCRMASTGSKLEDKLLRERRRVQRTNKLLISITVVFILSWLPLNLLNAYFDYINPKLDHQAFKITFAICHMWGMSSACSNPFLYGWLNDNFRKEFKEIFGSCFGKHIKLQTPVRPGTLDESDAAVKKDMTAHHQSVGLVSALLKGDIRDETASKIRDSERVGTVLVQDGDDTKAKVTVLSGSNVPQTGSPV